jgi:hypothetical protein
MSQKDRPRRGGPPVAEPEPPIDEEAADDAEGDDDDDEAPGVVLARVSDVAAWMPREIAKGWGARPVWFLIQDDAELVGLFERIPEDPVSKGVVEAILGGLRAFAAERSDDLQRVLGVTDAIGFGFHVDASFKQVESSFEDDGFVIAGAIREGVVVALEDDDAEA